MSNAPKRLRAPLPLVAMALIYLATELMQLGSHPPKMIVVRIVVYAVVFLAALHGSVLAAMLWGLISTLAAGAGLYALWQIASEGLARHLADDGPRIAFIAFQAVFFTASAIYIFSSKALREFQRSQRRTGSSIPIERPGPPREASPSDERK